MNRIFRTAFALVTVCAAAAPVSATPIGLASPLTGSTTSVTFVDLLVDLDLNGAAPNVVGTELYVSFAGLQPVSGTYVLGSVFQPFASELIEVNGVCAALFCNFPAGDPVSPTTYLSSVNVFAPAQPTGPGGLFRLRFIPDPAATSWSLNLFADDGFGLLADRCDPADANCVLDPAAIPFAVVSSPGNVPSGTAVVRVGAQVHTTSVPEPALTTLLLAGLAVGARRLRHGR